MKVVTADEMREIDRLTIERVGMPGSVLMERAGVAVAARIKELFGQKKVVVLAGGGNNGGDGIVCARELFNAGWNVNVLLFIKQDRLSPDCLSQFRIAKKMGVPIEFRTEISERDLHGAIVVDALLGTGLSKDIEGAMAKAIAFLNKSDKPVVSIDIPSGVSSDSGQIMGIAVKAGYTVSFGLHKRGHLLYPGAEYVGRLFIEQIGFPEDLLSSDILKVELMGRGHAASLIPERPRYSHKGDYGHVLIVAGTRGKTGAALMAAKACLRAGAGLVTIGVPESLMDIFQSRVTEEMTLPLPDRGDGSLSSKAAGHILKFISEKADLLCIGPGIGVSEDTRRLITDIIKSSRAPVVIDADGINSIGDYSILKKSPAPIVLTPHAGEMARLMEGSNEYKKSVTSNELRVKSIKEEYSANSSLVTRHSSLQIEQDRVSAALSFSKETDVCLVLKGAPTVITEPEGKAFINSRGNPGMATAGTGDVLTGMIGAFIGQGLSPLNASALAVYMHGLAGDIAAKEKGEHSLIASDIIDSLPDAFMMIHDS